jgi:hypothetical protein
VHFDKTLFYLCRFKDMPYLYDRSAASSRFNPETIRSIAKMTDENDVVGALVAGAKMLVLKGLEKKLVLVGKLQELEGHLPSGLKTYRDNLYDALMAEAKKLLSDEEYKKFYGAY